jgi:hypothetical protein
MLIEFVVDQCLGIARPITNLNLADVLYNYAGHVLKLLEGSNVHFSVEVSLALIIKIKVHLIKYGNKKDCSDVRKSQDKVSLSIE